MRSARVQAHLEGRPSLVPEIVDRDRVATRLLGRVQRDVGLGEQLVGGHRRVALDLHQPHAGGHADDLTLDPRGGIRAQHRQERLGHPPPLPRGETRQDHRELVAAQPGDDVRLAQAPLQQIGDPPQDRVADGVPVAVVDELEAVDVEHHEARRHRIALGERDGRGQLLLERTAVEQPRQRVVVGQMLQLGLDPPLLADVAGDLRRADHASVGVPDRRADHRHVDQGAVLTQPLGLALDRLPGMDPGPDAELRLQVVRRHEHLQRRADRLTRSVVHEALGALVPGEDRVVAGDADDRVLGLLDDRREPLIGLLGLLAAGDVDADRHAADDDPVVLERGDAGPQGARPVERGDLDRCPFAGQRLSEQRLQERQVGGGQHLADRLAVQVLLGPAVEAQRLAVRHPEAQVTIEHGDRRLGQAVDHRRVQRVDRRVAGPARLPGLRIRRRQLPVGRLIAHRARDRR